MAVRVTISLDEDVAAEIQKSADRSGRSLEEAVNDSLRSSVRPRLIKTPRPFEVRAKALNARPGINLDDIDELLERAEGPAHR
ncbi:MAG TPA: ribbon-helix-helix protein, CopG family [Thermoanaerobaculia bacterium]|nr:ribbon-helix-helix protein, CopG family [Thermoanaerobaculia bacterium]